jgi:predicted nucleotidyltransferase
MPVVFAIDDLRHPDMRDPHVLSRIADRLRKDLSAVRVLLYGSVARNQATFDSDIDLLIVAPAYEKGYLRMARARAAIRGLSFGLPISPIVLTPEEWQAGLLGGDAFLREIEDRGIEL